ncbi:MAG: flagellar hook protein FlgE [Rhodanobacteraceae bacterium]
MPFNISISGIDAASSDLDVASNNIANANTTGFKAGTAQFGDIFTQNEGGGVASTAIGSGVQLESVDQDFSQGNITSTGNALDLALNGTGFFTLSDNGSLVYTRAGDFTQDDDGYVVDSSGQRLQIFPATATGTINTGQLGDLQVPTGDSAPAATTQLSVGVNLPSGATPVTTTPFSPTDPTSYTDSTSTTVYDSLGQSHTAALYFIQSATPNTWTVQATVDGTLVGTPQTVTYNNNGTLTAPPGGTITLPAYAPTTGAAPMDLTLNLDDSTQYGGQFAVNSLQQNGYATGQPTGLQISDSGVISATFTNGQSSTLGQVALSNFADPQALQQVSDTDWTVTPASGPAIQGVAASGAFGTIQSGALEASNVDLSSQLVDLISAQRNYQANAQALQAESTVDQTLLQIH